MNSAKEMMSPLAVSIGLNDTLHTGLKVFFKSKLAFMLVLGPDGSLIGQLKRSDFVKGIIRHRDAQLSKLMIKDLSDFIEPVQTIADSKPYIEVIKRILTSKSPFLAVVNDSKRVVGTITDFEVVNRIAIREL